MKVSIRHGERRTRQVVQLVIRRTPLEGASADSSVELKPTQAFEFQLDRTERAEIALAGANQRHGPVPVLIDLEAEPGEVIAANCIAYGVVQPGESPAEVVRGPSARHDPVAACALATVALMLKPREACGVLITNVEGATNA